MYFNQTVNPIFATRSDSLDGMIGNLSDILGIFRNFIVREVTPGMEKCINVTSSPYNRDNIFVQEYEPAIIMFGDEIEKLTRSSAKAICKLHEIERLEEDWNENGAQPFGRELITLCKKIVMEMPVAPSVFPTACGSIQFEFTNEEKDYLEFEIFSDHTEIYFDCQGVEREENFQHRNNFIQHLRQVVVDFYG